MSYTENHDIYFFQVRSGGVRKWHSLVTADRAPEHLKNLQRSAWKAYKEGRAKNIVGYEARTVWGEVVEL